MQSKVIIAGNWKMNLSPGESIAYFAELHEQLKQKKAHQFECVIFPPVYCLNSHTSQSAHDCHIELGSQNIHWQDSGAFTGEVSGLTLKHMGYRWCLIGHSERRTYFGETDATAAKRLEKALSLGLRTVFCIGETLAQRESNETKSVIERQLQAILPVIKAHAEQTMKCLAIAYEPVWAIGTGKTATPQQAQEVHGLIRRWLMQNLPQEGLFLSLLYGGSVTPENANQLLAEEHIDGLLVGGASLKPDSFAKLIEAGHSRYNRLVSRSG